jgi:hypothetical protein
MSDVSLDDLAVRLDDLMKEVRRQGRAGIAAQAAAEACLEALQARAEEGEEEEAEGGGDRGDRSEDAVRWLRALIPVADSLDRVVRQAAAIEAPPPPAKHGLLRRLLPGGEAPVHEAGGEGARVALREGLRVLKAQLEGTFRELGVSVDRSTGRPVDGERQRVVEVRPPRAGERPGTVVEVVRPGYALGETLVREAEVVVTEGRH